jgi:hypothetical protein
MYKIIPIVFFLICSGCMYAVRYDGEYRGKVFDGVTNAPIEGAVVLGVWDSASSTPAGQVDYFYDARETLTDKNGEFSIPGMGLRVMSNLEPMTVMVFKSGYKAIDPMLWDGPWPTKAELAGPKYAKVSREIMDFFPFSDESGNVNFPLRKLTLQEQKDFPPPHRPSIPEDKMQLMTKEINRYNIELGLKPFTIRGVTK